MKFIYILLPFFLFAACKKEENQTANLAADHTKKSGEVKYTMPQEWQAEPPASRMRKAQYKIPGVDGAGDAELAVFVFPGGGGTVHANINRWVGQFKQPDGSSTDDKTITEIIKVNDLEVTKMYVTGTYLKSTSMMMQGPVEELPDYAMLAAIVKTGVNPWFFKATGPQKTIDHWQPAFDKFVQTLKIN